MQANIDEISSSAVKSIFDGVNSYRKGIITEEESVETCRRFLDYVISYIRQEDCTGKTDKEKFISGLISFEEGIVSKRIRYEIDLKDVLEALYVFNNVVWDFLRAHFARGGKKYDLSDFFALERAINSVFMIHMVDLTNIYIKIHKEFIWSQEAAFKKWETVVKSAHNIELNIPCREAYASVARMQAEAIARRLRFDEEKVQDIKIAIGEACANAIEHGSSRKGVDIHYHINPDNLLIEVKDYGQGFIPPKEEEVDLPLDLLSERGRGLYIMKALMDKVEVKSAPGDGTLVILDKKI